MQKKKCFVCGDFRHIICHYINRENIEENRRAEIKNKVDEARIAKVERKYTKRKEKRLLENQQ